LGLRTRAPCVDVGTPGATTWAVAAASSRSASAMTDKRDRMKTSGTSDQEKIDGL
jgi:hypothetical protein